MGRTPSYIWIPNSGNAAAKTLLAKLFAARALAE
jgi:hypothetical protein